MSACDKFGVKSQNDRDKLELAKDLTYKLGFRDGVFLVGEHSGKKVSEVKKLIRDKMVAEKNAFLYQEPEREVNNLDKPHTTYQWRQFCLANNIL